MGARTAVSALSWLQINFGRTRLAALLFPRFLNPPRSERAQRCPGSREGRRMASLAGSDLLTPVETRPAEVLDYWTLELHGGAVGSPLLFRRPKIYRNKRSAEFEKADASIGKGTVGAAATRVPCHS